MINGNKKKAVLPTHGECRHCKPSGEHLSNEGRPLIGRCGFMEDAFLLCGKTNCNQFSK